MSENVERKEMFSFTITVHDDSSITQKLTGESTEHADLLRLVGLLESVKNGLLKEVSVNNEVEEVEVELIEDDFKFPHGEEYKKAGYKAGDKVLMPKILLEARDKVLENLKAKE